MLKLSVLFVYYEYAMVLWYCDEPLQQHSVRSLGVRFVPSKYLVSISLSLLICPTLHCSSKMLLSDQGQTINQYDCNITRVFMLFNAIQLVIGLLVSTLVLTCLCIGRDHEIIVF